jgi:protein-S-isoprenylcysteine O-methyltransferase Ste14
MQRLSKTTKAKLIIPVIYFLATNTLFVTTFEATPIKIIGITVAEVAFVLWIIARVQLGNAFSIAPKSKFLVKKGLYSKLRHPVYYFSVMAVIGIGIFISNIYAALIVLALIILEVIRIKKKEEVLLTQSFGEKYIKYKQETWF